MREIKISKIISAVAILLLFITDSSAQDKNSNAQDKIREMVVEQVDNPELTFKDTSRIAFQRICDDMKDANICFYTSMPDLDFKSDKNNINEKKYIADKNKYVLCVDPGTFVITITRAGYAPKRVRFDELKSHEMTFFFINKEKNMLKDTSNTIAKGDFLITSNPDNANIHIYGNGAFDEKTPYTFKGGKWKAGLYKLIVEKDNYKTVETEIEIKPTESGTRVIELDAKKGFVTIMPENSSASNAKVLIDGEDRGILPVAKLPISQGKHYLLIEKDGFSTYKTEFEILENIGNAIQIKLSPTKEVKITSNINKSAVYIDNEYVGKAPFSSNLTIGNHRIEVQKENYASESRDINLSEDSPNTQYVSFQLSEKNYGLKINSSPVSAEVYLDGAYKGSTPFYTTAAHGLHTIKLKRHNYFTNTSIKNVSSSHFNEMSRRLFPNRFFNFNGLYGFKSYGVELGGIIQHFSFLMGWFPVMKNNIYNTTLANSSTNEVFEYDPNYMVSTNKKVSFTDSSGMGFSLKIGYTLVKPIPLRIHIGIGYRISFKYYDVYEATEDFYYSSSYGYGNTYVSSYGSNTVYKGDLIKGGERKEENFQSYIIGMSIPIRRAFNIQADYWYSPEGNSDFVFGIGLNLYKVNR